MTPSNFILLYLSKFQKGANKFILNRFDKINSLMNDNSDYLTYDLVENILPKNCLVVDSVFVIYQGSYKDHLMTLPEVRKFVETNKYTLFFEVRNSNIIVKGRSWSHFFEPRKTILINIFDDEYLLRRLNRLLELRVFS